MIELGAPAALVALLSVPLAIALYMLRPRRRTLAVSATLLWREALRERRQGLGLSRLLRDLSLLLIVLALVCLSLALAEPRWLSRGSERLDTVLVLDTSASMQARDVPGGRFERAKAAALDLVAAAPDGARTLLMTSGRRATLRSAFESDKQTLTRIVADLQATDEAGRPGEAMALALSLLSDRERGRVYFVTDGAHPPLAKVPAGRVRSIRVVQGAESGDNVAITRFDVRTEVGTEQRFQVLVRLHNYGADGVAVPLSVTLGERRLYGGTVALEGRSARTLVLPFEGRPVGRASAAIEHADALPADNRAFAVAAPEEALLIALVSPGNFYLESALRALPNAVLTVLHPDRLFSLGGEAEGHDVMVFDRVPLRRLPPGASLLVDTVASPLPLIGAGRESQPQIAGRGTSALLSGIDLGALSIDEARRVQIDAGGAGLQRLFWSERTELAAAWLGEQRRVVYLGFDPGRSSFPLQAAFPLFLVQALDWLVPRGPRHAGTQVAAGESFLMPVPAGVAEVIVTTPAGAAEQHRVDADEWRYENTARAGFYRYQAGPEVRDLAVNLTDEAESEIRPRAIAAEAAEAPVQGPPVRGEGQLALPLWPYLGMLALAALALEWSLRCARLT